LRQASSPSSLVFDDDPMPPYGFYAMQVRHALLAAPLVLFLPAKAAAQTSDPMAARGHFQQGFALNEQGRCNEALPYFFESIRLDRQPNTLIDLADCEEKIGKLDAASAHFSEARDLAYSQGLEPQRAIAEQRLQAIDKRLPRFTASVGFSAAPPPGDAAPGTGQRIAGFGLMGAGAVGLAIGTIFGLKVSENNREIDSICPTGQPCPPQSVADYHSAVVDAKINRAAALIGFGVGAVFVGTGALLVLTAPKGDAPGTSVWLTPRLGSSGAGAAVGGTW